MSWACSEGNHKVVALIAWQQLDLATRAKVVQLIRAHPRWNEEFAPRMPTAMTAVDQEWWPFAQAAIWPDLARELPAFHHASWHYVNEPVYLDAAARKALQGKLKFNLTTEWTPQTNVKRQNAAQTVDGALKTLRRADASDAEKGLWLTWLFHTVGDLHQPLHTVALCSPKTFPQGDRGGNQITIKRSGADPKPQVLHSFWDHLHGGDLKLNTAGQKVASILAEPGMTQKAQAAATALAPSVWLQEGLGVATNAVYTPVILKAVKKAEAGSIHRDMVTVILTAGGYAEYGEAAGAVASERAAIGGYRLAALLKQALNP